MKIKGLFIGLALLISLVSFSLVSAIGCDIQASLVNQDPYPAIPGEEAKLVFQINGIENPECGEVSFELIEKYPISLMPDQKSTYTINAGTFQKDYKSFLLAPYNVFVSEETLDGDNAIEVRYKHGTNLGWESKEFTLNVDDVRADFEVYVRDYDSTTKTLTFEILNIAEVDVEALTVEVAKQDNVIIKGSNVNIVGDLDSNDYTTFDFEATPTDGEIALKISYSDTINERRVVEKTVFYESEYFNGLAKNEKQPQTGKYVLYLIIALLVVWYFYRRNKKKKALAEKLKNRK